MSADPYSTDQTPHSNENALPLGQVSTPKAHVQPVEPVPPAPTHQNVSGEFDEQRSTTTQPTEQQPFRVKVVDDGSLTAFESKAVRFGWAGVAVAFFTLGAAVAAGWSAFQQFKEAAAQTELLSRSARQARSDSNQSSVVTAKQLAALQEQVTAAQGSQKVLEGQLREQQHALEVDQRAWLGVSGPVVSFPPDKPWSGRVDVSNTGKSPAINMTGRLGWKSVLQGATFTRKDITENEMVTSSQHAVIYPGEHIPVTTENTVVNKRQPEAAAFIGSSVLVPYVFGEIGYNDIFRKPHWLHFCFRLNADLQTGGHCEFYNDTDDQPEKR